MNKIKILFFITTLEGGGAEKVLVNLVNNLSKSNFDITVLTLFNLGINRDFLKNDIKYLSVFNKRPKGWICYLNLFSPNLLHKLLIKDKYDIEVAYIEKTCARIISGCNDKKTKLISWIHTSPIDKKHSTKGFRNFIESKRCYEKFNKICCVSNVTKREFNNIYNLSNLTTIYNVNENNLIYKLSNEEINFEYKKDEFNIISVGTLKPKKGYDRLAKIQNKLIKEGYKTHIYICGEGYQKNSILDYLKENNLENTWDFLGYNKNPYKYVSKADLFVCSSTSEGLSTVVTESLYVGTPVISTEVSGAKELLGENNEYGLVVDNNEDALYDGIKYLIDNPDVLLNYKKQAKIRGDFFSKENIIKQHEDLFKKVLNE